MWTLHCITVVTITRQCHDAAASKRASRRRSAQIKLRMRSCEEVRRLSHAAQCPNGAEAFFAAFAFSRALVPPESSSSPTISKSAPWCDWRLDRIRGKTKHSNYPVMVESISDWHHISIPQSITDYGSRVLKRCQIT